MTIVRETFIIHHGNEIPEGKKHIIFSYLSFKNG